MRFKTVAFTTAFLIVLPAVARADDTTAPAPKEKKVCRKVMVTGTIVPLKTVCLTAAEWAQVDGSTASINAKGIGETIDGARPMGSRRD